MGESSDNVQAGKVKGAVLQGAALPVSTGRPPKFRSCEEMEAVCEAYFALCKVEDKPLTVAGLCLALNLSRQGLCEYADKPQFSDTVKRAKLRIEESVESRLFGPSATGSIFWLKNNAGYVDNRNHEVNVRVTLEDLITGGE
jgi:hypothetical protein